MFSATFTKSFFLLLMIFFLNCGADSDEEKDTLEEDLFVRIYVDVVSESDLIRPELRAVFVDSIFTRYHTTGTTFQNTVNYYQRHPRKWNEVFEKIVAELEMKVRKAENQSPSDSVAITKF